MEGGWKGDLTVFPGHGCGDPVVRCSCDGAGPVLVSLNVSILRMLPHPTALTLGGSLTLAFDVTGGGASDYSATGTACLLSACTNCTIHGTLGQCSPLRPLLLGLSPPVLVSPCGCPPPPHRG